MSGSDGGHIAEGDRQIPGGHLLARDLTDDDAAEEAFGHRGNLPPDPLAARFLADARTAESARSRSREHWLRQQAEESALFAGALRAAAERGASARIVLNDGNLIEGRVVAGGAELLQLEDDRGPVWVAVAHIVRLTSPRRSPASEDRPLEGGRSLAGLMAGLAAERTRVELLVGGQWVGGELAAAGADVVSLRGREMDLVRIDAVTAVRPAQSPGSG